MTAFVSNGVVNVVIPDNLEIIDDCAFKNCKSLINVTLGSGVKTIGEDSFYGCSRINNLVIPNNVTRIEAAAFYNCSNLETVTIGYGVTYIGEAAFARTALKSAVFSDTSTWYRWIPGRVLMTVTSPTTNAYYLLQEYAVIGTNGRHYYYWTKA